MASEREIGRFHYLGREYVVSVGPSRLTTPPGRIVRKYRAADGKALKPRTLCGVLAAYKRWSKKFEARGGRA